MNLNNAFVQILDEFQAIFGRRYPEFVYGGKFPGKIQEVPVFVFHSIRPEVFERQLIYLRENNYNTITSEEYYEWSVRKVSIPEKSILLAIDDGVESVWQYGYPLLKKYGFRAVVFVIPGYIRSRSKYYCNLSDKWEGQCDREEVEQRESGYYNLMYWEELIEAENAGVLDIQSHSLYHHQVFQDDMVQGFFIPDGRQSFYDWVLPDGFEKHVNAGDIENYAGMPLYRSDAIFRTNRQYLDNDELRLEFVDLFKRLGGVNFYTDEKGAGKVLMKEFIRMKSSHPKGRCISGDAARDKILENLASAKSLLENKLGKQVEHLCYPYSLYSEETIELSMKAGYKTNFIGTYAGRRSNTASDDPMHTVRVKSDFILTLPGKNRATIYSVLANKARYRLKGEKYL